MQIYHEKNATLLLTDMVGFTKKTLNMSPFQVSQFVINYYDELKTTIMSGNNKAQYFDYASGDASVSVFENTGSEDSQNRSARAFKVTLQLIDRIKKKGLPPTRFGLYSGKAIEAKLDDRTLRFGNSFSAASRLQKLCDYFDTPMLMDRDVANAQTENKNYITCIGKITPKSLSHPIHIFTIYKPGIHKIPLDVDKEKLMELLGLKNQGVEFFHGNMLRNIEPDFLKARNILSRVVTLFKEVAGYEDIASKRILRFISENIAPPEDFLSIGITLENKTDYTSDSVNLYRLSREFLKALDAKFYNKFILDTDWKRCFMFQWKEKGEIIIEKGHKADGVYFLAKGQVNILNEDSNIVATVNQGDVFGEMAFFTMEKIRNYTVLANTDLELYFISRKDFRKHPEIIDLFERISKNRELANKNSKPT